MGVASGATISGKAEACPGSTRAQTPVAFDMILRAETALWISLR
jgi:hypothetical protein